MKYCRDKYNLSLQPENKGYINNRDEKNIYRISFSYAWCSND